MDLRRDPRFQTIEELRITLIDQPQNSVTGRLKDASAHGFGIVLSQRLAVGSLIRVEWSDTLILGEVIHCQRLGEGFLAGIEVDEILDKAVIEQLRRHSNPSL